MLDFFQGFAKGFQLVIDFILDLVNDIVYMVQLVGSIIVRIPSYFSWIPGEVLAILATIFSIVVIYKIIGREG